VSKVQQGLDNTITFTINAKQRAQMTELLQKSNEVITSIDGACVGNPGPSGCGVAFFSKETRRNVSMDVSDSEVDEKEETVIKYLFGVHMHLGLGTSNSAEYAALILAQIIHSMCGSKTITIKTDS
jgi:ribonuclease HI